MSNKTFQKYSKKFKITVDIINQIVYNYDCKLKKQADRQEEIEMKVRQFLNKLLYASSSIHRIFVVRGVEEKTQLIGIAVNPMATDTPYEKQLNATLVSFRITGEDLTIYVK